MSILRCEHLTMRFGGVTAVDDFSPEVNPEEIVAIIGPNGAGKTTAFNMITGVYQPTAGRVHLETQAGQTRDITGIRPDQVAALGIARTFQNIRLFKSQTVLENVLIAGHVRIKSGLFGAEIGWPRYYKEERDMRGKAMALLEQVGLADAAGEISSSLPYGKQRRLEIARALATQPKLLLLDEPAAGMNPKETEDLTRFVFNLREKTRLAILMIEHHMQIVMDISDRIYVLDYGKTIAHGTPDQVQENPTVIEAYLGVDEE